MKKTRRKQFFLRVGRDREFDLTVDNYIKKINHVESADGGATLLQLFGRETTWIGKQFGHNTAGSSSAGSTSCL